MSDPEAGLPAWLEFHWEALETIGRIEIIFDSGLHRRLTLTMSEAIAASMVWGTGQPEMVKAFSIQYRADEGRWQELARVPLFWQRRWIHSLECPIQVRTLRIAIDETWGIDHARIVAVRILSPEKSQ